MNGNVGIGTVAPSSLLHVNGAINCTSFLVNGTAVATGTGSVWGVNGSYAYYTSGYVGIGTITPSASCHIYNTSGDRNTSLKVITMRAGLWLESTGAGGSYWNMWSVINGETTSAGSLAFYSASGYAMTLSPGGNITLGNSTSAVGINFLDLPSASWQITTGNYNLAINNNSASWTNRVTITQTGLVGIGTTTPTYPITVSTSGSTGLEVNRTGASTNYGVGTIHSLTSATGSFRGEYAWALGGATTIATSAQSQAYGYYAIDLANAGAFASTSSYTGAYFFMTTSAACFPKTNVGIGTDVPLCRLMVRAFGDGVSPTNWIAGAFGPSASLPRVVLGTFGSNAIIGAHNSTLDAWANLTINPGGNVTITGTLSKGGGSFDIHHPLFTDAKKRLVHSFVEGPRCDLIYRGKTTLVNGTAVVDINKECTHSPECAMDDGTFEALCGNPQIFLQNNQSFDRVRGAITGSSLTITCETPVSIVIEWMVIAERIDPFIKKWDRTNSDGYLVTQYTMDHEPLNMVTNYDSTV
jgi:hypothetical protein